MFALVVRFDLHAGSGDAFDALMARTVPAIRSDEPGTWVYICCRIAGEPDARLFMEVYADRAAFEQHERTPATLRFLAERGTLVAASRVEFLTPYEYKLTGAEPEGAGLAVPGSEGGAMDFSTRAIHAGQAADPATGATIVPVYQTSTFTQRGVGDNLGYDYSRTVNPTRTALETQLAALEEARYGSAFASGMAATAAVLNVLSAGDHVVVSDDLYGGTYRLFTKVLARYGLTFSFVDMSDHLAVTAAIGPNTKLLWIETPTNPLLKLVDIAAVGALRPTGAIVVVDNTFASPYFQSPLALGADVVVHSTTKYIGGHSDVVGGAALTNDSGLHDTIKFHQNAVGGVPGPMDAWLTMRGAKTLAIRMREHEKNAGAVAHFLEARDDVARVYYPGLASHPQHALARRQMRGFGGMVSFTLRGPDARAREFVKHTKLFSLAESLGGVESLISIPAGMTHGSIPVAERLQRGITDGLVRLSVGIEGIEDLIADLTQALDATLARAAV
jgi:cystathionine beta-lyase/cystathionine gamma-synthase/quinol monooxygenase YgiN